jgi:hypothetical protein
MSKMDPQVVKFYASLSPAEKEAHELAAKMLGSSYIVKKTHSYIKWLKKQQEPVPSLDRN